jgi:hypothetical protein
MNKALWILIDAVILFAVSTFFVLVANLAFSGLKGKTPKDDPIVTAITQGNMKELEAAAMEGGKVAALLDAQGRTALMRAAYVNLSGDTLLAAADEKRAAMIPLLLEHAAPLDQQDHDGWSALMWASWSGLPKVVEQLLAKGALHTLSDAQGHTALMLAARRGNTRIVQRLIDSGADPTSTTRTGTTARNLAQTGLLEYPDKQASYQEILRLLAEK